MKRRWLALSSVLLLLGSFLLAHWLFTPQRRPITTAQALASAKSSYVARQALAPVQFGVSGTVRDADARPIAGAAICAACANCEGTAAPPSPCTQSDAQGRYALVRLAPGGYYVTAAAAGFVPGSPQPGRPVFVENASRADLDIVLERGGAEIAGVVIDATGGPISHAHVRAIRMAQARIALDTQSDDLGRFAFHVSDGPLLLVAEADGYAPARASYVAPNAATKLMLVPGGSIGGEVVAAENAQPVPGVQVHAMPVSGHGAGLSRTATSDAQGRFDIDGLEPGGYTLVARAEHFVGEHPEPLELDLGGKAHVRLELTAATEVKGRVVVGDGAEPCRQGFVTLGGPDPTAALPVDALDQNRRPIAAVQSTPPGAHQFAQIEADGNVRFAGVPSGYYFVSVQCVGHVLHGGPRLLNVEHEPTIADLRWDVVAGTTLAIKVVDASREAVAGARLQVRWPSLDDGRPVPLVPMVADAAGHVEIPGLAPGKYELSVPGGADAAEPVLVDVRGPTKIEATLMLRGNGAIEVELKAEHGEAVEDARLTTLRVTQNADAADAAPVLSPIEVDIKPLGAGRFRLGPLAEGRYVVRADDGVNPPVQSGDGANSFVTVSARSLARVGLRVSRGGTIRGRVIDEAGEPLPNVWVSATHAQDAAPAAATLYMPGFGSAARRVLTDPTGNFVLEGLASGETRYTLRAEQAYGGTAVRRAARPGETVDIRLPATRTLAGTAVDANDRPLQEFTLRALTRETGTQRQANVRDAAGRFVLTNVVPGSVQLTLSAGDAEAESEIDLVAGHDLSGLRFVLRKPEERETASDAVAPAQVVGFGR